ncbi:FAD-binding oxidoreductase [Sinorhizobium mexicanum]|uniref:FAD-binding oxidoreductase n=1 Tax=Sinorhizobium mexicanum TaxID=375549 RepID=A0A859R2Y5_9HYPH|nr:FAD-binding oxidoreductase [Sinorhizobium mexicanum]MBP1886724.1 FAD/FMN-containing dehydrogenase [Sinorhizobium mexicanum]QLL65939.1 FAD-binding oxidoreductase [Sinorhizobium mexicanum]
MQPDDMTFAAKGNLRDEARLRRTLRGEAVLPGDPGYQRARQVWNGLVDKRPAAIAYCAGTDDVVAALSFARENALTISVRSGGHNVAGNSVCEGGLVIDLSRMKNRSVDDKRCVAWAEAGLTLAEFDGATQVRGLATTMGVNGDTGIAGLTLGGGFGKLGRRFGLACDNLLSAEVVTADGRVLRASADENPDLFWGLRGGGGNFGIVTGFEYGLHPIGTEVVAGGLVFPEAKARDALRFYDEFARTAPDELSLDAALVTSAGEWTFSISIFHSGPPAEAAKAVAPLLEYARRQTVNERLARTSYLTVQSAGDAVFPRGRRYAWKAQFMRELTDDAIDVLLDVYRKAPSDNALFVLQQVGGAIARVPVSETAYACRNAEFDCFPIAIWDDPARDEKNIGWVREVWAAIRPFSTGAVYVNNLGDEGQERVKAAYGPNYQRLVELKTKYDPMNIFCLNQNIKPMGCGQVERSHR